MTLERRLQIHVAVMTSLGTLLLAVAERDLGLAVLAATVAGTSVYFADIKRWVVLNTFWSNITGVVALVLTLWHWQSIEQEQLFVALANYLTYLQCILHYRVKALHVYGMLILLSFLQMAVASVLAATFLFGCLLVVYLWVALRTLCLFSIVRERIEVMNPSAAKPFADTITAADLLITPIHHLFARLWRRSGFKQAGDAPAHVIPRWPLSRQSAKLSLQSRSGEEAMSLRGLTPLVIKCAAATLLIGPLVFMLIPRMSQQTGGAGTVSFTGFTDRVMLRDVTRIRENPDQAMRFRVYDYTGGKIGQPYALLQQPWLRGTALGRYAWGSWRPEDWPGVELTSLDDVHPGLRDVLPDPGENDLVLLEVTLEPLRSSSVVFTLEPAYRVPGGEPSNLRTQVATHEFYRPRNRRSSTFTYQLLTTGLKNGRQTQFRRQEEPYAWEQKTELLEPFAADHVTPDRLRYAPRDAKDPSESISRRQDSASRQRARLQGLAAEAAGVLQRAGIDPKQNPREAALALERYLHHEGGFTYTLNPPPRRRSLAEEDPINEFVVQGRQGHCEYFASALALMLRSQGIPSRLIVGYKGGEWNSVGGYYEVRQLEAHAWVEAWIFQGDQPLGWLRLDPTPGAQVPVVTSAASWKQISNYVHYLWARYVLGMDATFQEELTQPLLALFQRETWENAGHWVLTAVVGEGWPSQEAFNWRAGVVAVGAQLLLVLLYGVMRVLIIRVRAWRRRRAPRLRNVPQIDFYVRLERVLARCGLARRESQTPWEFAESAANLLAGPALTLAPILLPIVQAYYGVRFGGASLSDHERREIEEELARLEAAVATAEGNARHSHPDRVGSSC